MPTTDLFKFVSVRPAELIQDRKVCEYVVDGRITQNSFSVQGDNASVPLSVELESAFYRIRTEIVPEDNGREFTEIQNRNATLVNSIKDHWDTFLRTGGETLLNRESEFLSQVRKVLENHIGGYRPNELFKELEEKYQAYWKESTSHDNNVNPPSLITLLRVPSEDRSISELLRRNFNVLYIAYMLKRRWPVNLETRIQHLQTLHALSMFVTDYCYKLGKRKGCLIAFLGFLPALWKWVPKFIEVLKNVLVGTSKLKINPSTTSESNESVENVDDKDASGAADTKTEGDAPTPPPPTYTTSNKFLFMVPVPIEISKEALVRAKTEIPTKQLCPQTPCSVNSGQDLEKLLNAQPVIPSEFAYLLFFRNPYNPIRPVGIGDLKVVKQELCEYLAGEVAHIENVLKGEFKERSHRRLNRTEDILVTEQETIETEERELQTTDQFEMQKEAESVIQTDMNVQAGLTVSGGFGPVEITAYGDFAYSRSKQDSQRSASNFSKEVVDRSLKRVQNKVREERTLRRINEVEEINKHGIDNKNQSKHVSGIYRFVDKKYQSQIYNYGRRLMFEFVVPEPGEFYADAQRNKPKETIEPLKKPKGPEFPPIEISKIDQAVVDEWSKKYNLTNLRPQPPSTLIINDSLSQEIPQPDKSFASNKTIVIDSDYVAKQVTISGFAAPLLKKGTRFFLNIAGEVWSSENVEWQTDWADVLDLEILLGHWEQGPVGVRVWVRDPLDPRPLPSISKQIFVSLLTEDIKTVALDIIVEATLKEEVSRQWQIDTYNKIMDAYQVLHQQYISDLAAYEALKQSRENRASQIQITGRNERINQQIIKEELKKQCISLITKYFDNIKSDETAPLPFDAMKTRLEDMITKRTDNGTAEINSKPLPALSLAESFKEGRLIQFFEQAFDWENIMYLLYPYFWGQIKKWYEQYKYLDERDYLFGQFLRAGSARVLISVRPHYELAVVHYLYTGEVWNGGPAPVINDDLYIPVHEELRNQQDDLHGGTPEGEPWEYIVPTPLVYLQQSSELPKFKS
ncbi:hypothetical protein L0337_17750 [candidate division KSB1 bacterium]|nr:hypothetical protein [candidate division KSB1 bacterium]